MGKWTKDFETWDWTCWEDLVFSYIFIVVFVFDFMFSKVVLFVVSAFVIGIVIAGFVFSQTPLPVGHPFSQTWCDAPNGFGCVTNQWIASGAIDSNQLQIDSVTSSKITDQSILAVDVNKGEICTQAEGCSSGWRDCLQVGSLWPSGTSASIVLDSQGFKSCRDPGCEMRFVKLDNTPSSPIENDVLDYISVKFIQLDSGLIFGGTPTSGAGSGNVPQKWRSWVSGSTGTVVTNTGTNGDSTSAIIANIAPGIDIVDDLQSAGETQADAVMVNQVSSVNRFLWYVCR